MNISNSQLWKYSSFIENKNYSFSKDEILKNITKEQIDEAYLTISKWDSYNSTPLLQLNKLTKELNLNKIYYKDESKRFSLKSFKALGGAYAVEKITKGNKDITVSTATAGNHGRSVAWGAKRLGLKCKIFISEYVSDARGKAMQELGADVVKVKGNYENSLIECIKQSTENSWQIESIKTGKLEKVNITRESLMGGMSCGEPSLVPWKILKKSVNNCISIPDDDIGKAMKLFANASFGDDKIVAGENSVPGVISLIASCNDQNIKNKLDLDIKSKVLLIGCEGDTDQEMYQKLIKE